MSLVTRNQHDPTYLTRQDMNLGALAAGSGGVTSKFVAFANTKIYSMTTCQTTNGTSTYTQSGIPVINGQQISVIVVANTATSGQTATLSTTTLGPFIAGGTYAPNGTGTGQLGGWNQFQLNSGTGTNGFGGVLVPVGAQVYCVSGTDATAVNAVTIDYQIPAGAGVTE